jgi:hypothetical protein
MKLELKSIKFIEEMSEETNCFYGKLYINGKYRADVRNDGKGGCTWVQCAYGGNDIKTKQNKEVIAETEQYLRMQPKKKCDMYDFEYQRTLESEVDDLFADWLNAKENKKFEKKMNKGILYGTKYDYKMIYWTNSTLTALLNSPIGKARVTKLIQELTEKGETILNTNIPKECYPKK